MKETLCNHAQSILVFTFVSTMLILATPLFGQIDVEIAVSGPWDFYPDNDRVAIMAPIAGHHGPVMVFTGEDVEQFGGQSAFASADFNLEVKNLNCSNPKPSHANTYKMIKGIDPGLIAKILHKHQDYKKEIPRYTISLPVPCYYTSEGLFDRMSIVSATKITSPSPQLASPYATVTILHYQVSSIEPAALTATSDDGTILYSDSFAFGSNSGGSKKSITIVMASATDNGDPECDSNSTETFRKSRELLGLEGHLFVHFPQLFLRGDQSDDYSTNCIDDGQDILAGPAADAATKAALAPEIFTSVRRLQRFLEKPVVKGGPAAKKVVADIRSKFESWPGGAPVTVSRELKAAETAIDHLALQKNAKSMKAQPRLPAKNAGNQRFFEQTLKLLDDRTPGSGDCNKAQLSINDVFQ
jgi:hypothetical protein